jgi:hypothetical protein
LGAAGTVLGAEAFFTAGLVAAFDAGAALGFALAFGAAFTTFGFLGITVKSSSFPQ